MIILLAPTILSHKCVHDEIVTPPTMLPYDENEYQTRRQLQTPQPIRITLDYS